jgi:hypothetical protein
MALELSEVSRPHMAVVDDGLPLGRGAATLLRSLAIAHERDLLTGPDASEALLLLAERLDYATGEPRELPSPEKGRSMPTTTFNRYPFSEIPEGDKPLTDDELHAALAPLLKGLDSMVSLLAEGALYDAPSGPELHQMLVLLSGLLGLAVELIDRWEYRLPGAAA